MVAIWLRGLVAALVGGAANGVAVRFVDGEHFNINDGLSAFLKIIAVGAVLSVIAYLKQSPIPGALAQPQPGEEQPAPKPVGTH